jgi:hypothetical protein
MIGGTMTVTATMKGIGIGIGETEEGMTGDETSVSIIVAIEEMKDAGKSPNILPVITLRLKNAVLLSLHKHHLVCYCSIYYFLSPLTSLSEAGKPQPGSSKVEENVLDDEQEEGEEMDAVNEEDAAMMGMMGMSGFGSTKVSNAIDLSKYPLIRSQGKHVTGNQEGVVNIKKIRTWRQYMNRRVKQLITVKPLFKVFLFQAWWI